MAAAVAIPMLTIMLLLMLIKCNVTQQYVMNMSQATSCASVNHFTH